MVDSAESPKISRRSENHGCATVVFVILAGQYYLVTPVYLFIVKHLKWPRLLTESDSKWLGIALQAGQHPELSMACWQMWQDELSKS